jgi:predicted GIY-YIG superfamily endonuclease
MPRKEINYKKTVIYKIVSKDLNSNFIYIGSTTDFTKRKNAHKTCCINEQNTNYNFKVYKTIRENGDWIGFQMIKIENYPCNDKTECLARERYWYERYNANLNYQVPNRSKKEYYKDKKVELLEKQNIYNKLNKEKISKKQNNKYNCICGGKYTNCHKSHHFKTLKHQTWLQKQNTDSESSSDNESNSSNNESDSLDNKSESSSDIDNSSSDSSSDDE